MAAELPKTAIKKIHAAVDKLLDRAKARVLGNPKQDKRIYVGVRPRVTLPQLYAAAASAERALADKSHLHSLMSIAESYIESQRAIIKAKVEASVRAFLAEADAGGIDTDPETVLGGQLADVWKKATSDMTKIVATESNAAKNVGVMEGIVKINAASGIEDPIVYFVVVHDNDLCDECKRLHLMEDEVTPRLWFLSEVKQGYHKKTDDAPSLLGEHPHCRCTPVTLMPGYGFVGGHAEFIELGHNEMAKQRGLEKSESLNFEPLEKSTRDALARTWPSVQKHIARSRPNQTYSGRMNENDVYHEDLPHSRITVNFPSSLAPRIADSGRWKNLHETGDGMGTTDTNSRLGWESNMGIPDDAEAEERPIYGALAWNRDHRNSGAGRMYGDAWATLKPDVKERASFTPFDSSMLDEYGTHHVYDNNSIDKAVDAFFKLRRGSYTEAQIHGGVYPEDVQSFHAHQANLAGAYGPGDVPLIEEQNKRRLEPMEHLARTWNVPLYTHTPVHGSSAHDVALVHDPRPGYVRSHHHKMRDRIAKDVSNFQDRMNLEAHEHEQQGEDTAYEDKKNVALAAERAYDALRAPYNQHDVIGHEHFVQLARQHDPAAFDYLGPKGEIPEVKQQEELPLATASAPAPEPQPEPQPPKRRRKASAPGGSRTSRKRPSGTTPPAPGTPPGSTTP